MVPASLSAKDFKGSCDPFFLNTYGLGRYGGSLFNIINSISPRYWNNWGVMIKVNF